MTSLRQTTELINQKPLNMDNPGPYAEYCGVIVRSVPKISTVMLTVKTVRSIIKISAIDNDIELSVEPAG